jgi:hypothetical protein
MDQHSEPSAMVMDHAKMTFAEMGRFRLADPTLLARLSPLWRMQLEEPILQWIIHLLLSKPRKNQAQLTTAERDAFNAAVGAALADGTYQQFPTWHSQPHMMHGFMGWTGTLRFLAWHRAFLYQMEKVLQDHVPGVTIPYWDWANDHELPAWVMLPAGVTRGPNTTYPLPNQSDINSNVLGAGDYITMTQALEGYHNTVHMYVGGNTMPYPAISPNDPMFWLHHANVDRLWSQWQAAPGHAGMNPPLSGTDAQLDPWLMPLITANDVLDTYNLWYFYQ